METKLKLVKINSEYCNYLRQFDEKVSYNSGNKELRPFIGILFTIENLEYFAPLSSPKSKHLKMKNTIDFIKIDGGKLGAVNFNNMIPLCKNNYQMIKLDKKNLSKNEIKYQELLKDQLDWLNKNYVQIKHKSYNLYFMYTNNRLSKNIKNRCCNFKLLERKCEEYKLK